MNELIIRTADTCFGQPRIAGTRIPPSSIRGQYRGGDSITSLMSQFNLTREQVVAAINYRSWARNRVFPDGYEPCPFRKCSHRNPCQNSLGWKAGECAAYQEWFANRDKAGERGE